MSSFLFVSILAILSTLLFNKKGSGLKLAFVILTLFIGLRYNYGNDTKNYMDLFYEIERHHISVFDIHELINALPYEPGWLFLNNVFGGFGWFFFQFLLAAFECFVLYDFINSNVPRKYQWLSVAIFTLSSPFMFIGACSMMRQWLACIIFIFSFRFIKSRNIFALFVCYLICISMHRSAIVLLPAMLLTFLSKDLLSNRISIMVSVLLITLWYMFSNKAAPYLDLLLLENDNLNQYTTYQEGANIESFSIIGFIAVFFMPLFCLTQISKHTREDAICIYICLLSLLFTPLQTYSIMIGRLSIYFSVMSIMIYPKVLSEYTNQKFVWLKIFIVLIILLPAIKDLLTCFTSPTYKDAFGVYHSILF